MFPLPIIATFFFIVFQWQYRYEMPIPNLFFVINHLRDNGLPVLSSTRLLIVLIKIDY